MNYTRNLQINLNTVLKYQITVLGPKIRTLFEHIANNVHLYMWNFHCKL